MRTTKFFFSFFIIIAVLTFQSCENEPLDSDLIDIQNNEGGDENNDGDIGDSTGDYWPRAIGNMWDFNDTFYGEVTYDMVSTESIDGNTYYKFDDLLGQESWLRKTGDSYFIRTAAANFPIEGYEITTTYITLKMLVDSAEVGEEWVNNVSYTISYTPINAGFPEIPDIDFGATYTFKMMGRDLTRTVEGTEYQNVLHIRLTLLANGVPTATNVDYYYAKDIGLIEFIGDQSSGTLVSYSLN